MLEAKEIVEAVVGALIVVRETRSIVIGRDKKRDHRATLAEIRGDFSAATTATIEPVKEAVRELKSLVVGPLGDNGIRSEIREIAKLQKEAALDTAAQRSEWRGWRQEIDVRLGRAEDDHERLAEKVDDTASKVTTLEAHRTSTMYDRRSAT